jgi:hypothetical protein
MSETQQRSPLARPATAADQARRGARDALFAAACVLVGAWALFQNFFKIGTAPILADEPVYTTAGWRYLYGKVSSPPPFRSQAATPANFEHPPLAKYLFGLAQRLSGTPGDLTASRCVSAAATVLAAVVAGIWLARAAGRWPGLLAAGLLAVLPQPAGGSDGRFGRFAMLDPLATLFMVLSVVLAWEWFRQGSRQPSRSRQSPRRWSRQSFRQWSRQWFRQSPRQWFRQSPRQWFRQSPRQWFRHGSRQSPRQSFRHSGRRGWVLAVATGGAVALAAGAKENGWLGVVGPVVLILVSAAHSRRGSVIRARLGQTAAAVVVAVAGFAALYLPISDPISAIRYLVGFQTTHSSDGHLVGFAGRVTSRPPWWANLWFAGHGYGSVLTGFIVVAALCAVVLRRDLLVGWCAASLAAPFVFHCFVAHVALSFYWVMWTPMVLVLAALGVCEVVGRAARVRRWPVPLAVATAVALLLVPELEGVEESVATAQIHPVGPEALPALMAGHHLSGPIVSTGVAGWEYSYYLPSVAVTTSIRADASVPADTIAVAKPQCRDALDPAVRALVAVNEASGDVRQIYSDATMTVYAVVGTLKAPTPDQVADQPPSRDTDGC